MISSIDHLIAVCREADAHCSAALDFLRGTTNTQCWLQPLIPEKGINPVTEIEVLKALNDPSYVVTDMPEIEWYLNGTIPGSVHTLSTEIATRMDEFGCKKADGTWSCDGAKNVLGFCDGPVCPHSTRGMKAMIREGFPAEKIYCYRGGMLDWDALGLTVVGGSL